jgi:hypothetical protein
MRRAALLLLVGCSAPSFEVGAPLVLEVGTVDAGGDLGDVGPELGAVDAGDAGDVTGDVGPELGADVGPDACRVPDGAGWCDLNVGGCDPDPIKRCALRPGWINVVPACGVAGLVVTACTETAEGCVADSVSRVQSCEGPR